MSSSFLRIVASPVDANPQVIDAAESGQTPFVMGEALLFISTIFRTSFVPQSNVVNERKKQTLQIYQASLVA